MNMRTSRKKAAGIAAVVACLLLASCGSETNSTLVEAETDVESPTTTEAPPAPTAEPVVVVAETPEGTINIETEIHFETYTGTFVVDEGAEALGCGSGSVVERGSSQGVTNTFTCENGDREGTFTFVITSVEEPDGPWSVLAATGDFAGMTGEGLWSGFGDAETGFGSFPGVVEFGPVGPTAEADPAIVADLDAYVVAFFTDDTAGAWNTVSARCQDVLEKETHDGWVAELTLTAPGATVSDISTVVEGDRAAVTYNVFDDAGVLYAPYFAQPWIFADGNWHWDNC